MAKKKEVKFQPIDRTAEPSLYELLSELVSTHHQHLEGAAIVLVWRFGDWASKGKTVLGQCRKASEMDARLHGNDFAIVLGFDTWGYLDKAQQRAVLDHELCHAIPDLDLKSGIQKEDKTGRRLWKIRPHDIEEFSEIVERHGCYLKDIEEFAERLVSAPLFNRGKQRKGASTAPN